MWSVVVLLVIALVVIGVGHWVYSWRNPKCKGKLPPGSMGFPIIGETLQFFTPHNLYDLPPFITKRVARYGQVFRTSLVGRPVVVSTDSDINHYISQQEDKYFHCWYTESFVKILGEQSMLGYHGLVHKYLKNLILRLVSPEALRQQLLHEMHKATSRHLQLWSTEAIVEVKEATSNMIFEYFAKKLFSYEEPKAKKKLRENFTAFIDGLISYPVNIPGTVYHACIQGRKNALKVIKDVFYERQASIKRPDQIDFMDILIEEVKKEDTILNEEIAMDMIFILLFATYETTATAISLAVNFIADHPSVLAELTKEHEAILSNLENKDSELSWKDYKSMTFTHMVINETVRLGNIVPGIFRKVIKDVEIKGYTIPAGWLVMVCPPAIHLDPSKYENPLEFNPWRWQGQELHTGSKTFMAFGGGVRLCVGADFAKLQMAIFLHHLVSKYRWKKIKGGNVVRRPGLVFPDGLHIQISEKLN